MRLFLAILLVVISLACNAQDYINYNRVINRVDACVLDGDLQNASVKMDSLYSSYSFIFARHCFKALQIACEMNDEKRMQQWLTKCFLQGVQPWHVRCNEITKKVPQCPNVYSIFNSYDSLHKIYESHINLPLAKTVDDMFACDQKLTDKVNNGFPVWKVYYYPHWLHNNGKQYRKVQSFIKQYGYPGEKLIGLPERAMDSAKLYKFFVRRGHNPLQRADLLYMMIHCYSNPRKDIRPQLLEELRKGNLQPDHYGAMLDFMAEYGRQKYGHYEKYHQWTFNCGTDTAAVNIMRDAIGLPSFQQRKKASAALDSVLKYNIRNRILSDL